MRLARFNGGQLDGNTVVWTMPGEFPPEVMAQMSVVDGSPTPLVAIPVSTPVPEGCDLYRLTSVGDQRMAEHEHTAQGARYEVVL